MIAGIPFPRGIIANDFAARLRARDTKLKPLLLNQAFVAGLGNIYVDEILFRARLHPLTAASSVPLKRSIEVHAIMRQILLESIAQGEFKGSHREGREGRQGRRC